MKSSAKNIRLTPVDDLFSSEESRTDANRERVVELPLAELHPFKNHPFKVLDDEKMADIRKRILDMISIYNMKLKKEGFRLSFFMIDFISFSF